MQEDQHIIRLAKSGDIAAFNQLVLRYQNQAYNVAYRLLGDPDGAADATQEAFIKAYQRLHQLRGEHFRPWLLRIVTNTCYDILRRRARRATQPLDAMEDEDPERLPRWQSDEETPEEVALRHEIGRAVEEGLLELSPEHRAVVVLSDIEGLSYEEISQVLNIPVGTVKSRLSRARARLRDYLRSHYPELLPAAYRQ
ncbi:MAG: sigma-70 family RNA polymerase sigma factor [Chloroflexi bacterium]|nr:sigma-70 family RNA polymerase sigma factor [Chloroflexota bacterium]